ncbi:MAG: DNA repair protein RadA [Ignavibacteriota bacterium]|nr:MAG: DNA repair protein RadA [Chlorobiota bacterium]MBE7475596.1 DNA repair protein RadA [Ignavibacteriales bacterium]MBL1123094.1 DNA repair protein RadA [Ignavibacteriota bacterium]MCE7855693.1 DNA repair protein RadA [Ignavibacteria bacterium CHB3]MCL4278417.1 DNA repair protein RadA [Ignavibacteriaceae bacterium]MEB2295910.1 DNA repair protein RadA [Ignavibacteria bacterium]
MSKTRIKYICSNCGYESLRWLGKCPECESWNSFIEEIIETSKRKPVISKSKYEINTIDSISANEEDRIKTGITEFDRVLGGGLMPGSVILLGGDPGIGKSTLAMQATANINRKVLYATGEESEKQIKLRASRLKIKSSEFFVHAETNLSDIIGAINQLSPSVVVIDSIQTMYRSELDNSPGTITQIRECTALLMEEAKKKHYCVIIIGHVTKEGMIAGPKLLEHIVDTVIQFEGESNHSFRILRAQKNRFGSTNEIGVFEMHEDGLREVNNPSELFLSEREKQTPGSVVTSSIEGTRPILLEVQALVTPSNYGYPQRVSNGFDQRRLSILLAVLEKRANVRVSAANVFVNIAGGIRITEPAADLAVCSAIASSLLDKIIGNQTIIIGEVGLGGEIRSVGHIEKRIQEAKKLGFKSALIPYRNTKELKSSEGITINSYEYLDQVIKEILTN